FCAMAVIAWCPGVASQEDENREALRMAVERLRYNVDGANTAADANASRLVALFYERRNFFAAWEDSWKIRSLITVVEDSYKDGLSPTDYHLSDLTEQYARARAADLRSPEEWAAFELDLTDALISLVHHQRFGKADPLSQHATWNYKEELHESLVLEIAEKAVSARSPGESLEESIPRGPYYRRLRGALASYRDIASSGGWPSIEDGPSLDLGLSDERVPVLAARLSATGDLDDASPYFESKTVDGRLQEAIRRFQERHSLEADGIAGPATIRALNVPVEERVAQLRLTLERARWVLGGLGRDFVLVNIAGFRAYVIDDGQVAWETRVVIGKAQQQTPVFRDELQYIVFNPTWTVPYSIATREMLPEIKLQPDWFAKHDFDLKDSDGEPMDPSTVDWASVTRQNFNYIFVQRPGPNNALGEVKFMFPNEHAVYLHDTPARQLFASSDRAFSHGCIRVEHPLELAEILLAANGWDRGRIDAAIASGETTTVFLAKPLPILLLYWTANVTPDGTVHFYRDVYRRDAAIAQALDGPFSIP
ncbi:MAG TPA: L,D-transpeptidase family protein, partial [Woeseiaceae bacterium]|nr:L,D-transpeptidase family protein [Woeseiaceae bacterium]